VYRSLAIVLILIFVVSPVFGACTERCTQEFVDTTGDDIPDVQVTRCETVTQGNLLTCDPIVRCWRMPGAGRVCEATCDGSPCYWV
jgi:hypothetical protein